MIKKNELTDETKVVMGHTLHRIRALKSFRAGTEDDTIDVDNGDSGGWIEQECNLSQSGTAWVDDTSCAFGNAAVADDALIAGYSKLTNPPAVRLVRQPFFNARKLIFALS